MPIPENFELPVINRDPRSKRRGQYGPDNPPPGKGRPKGSINKATRDLKNGILTAAENLGRDGQGEGGLIGFLEYLGLYHTKSFASLLAKMLPLNLNTTSVSASIGSVNVISVPVDHFLTGADIERLRPELPVIEHVSQEREAAEVEHAVEFEPIEKPIEPEDDGRGVYVVRSASLAKRRRAM